MATVIHRKTGFPIFDPQIPPFPATYQPNPTARRQALSSLILSVSGFRKVFAYDGKDESTTSILTQGDRELVFGMGIAFARFLQKKTGSPTPLVALGLDTRFTGPTMAEILLYALLTCGCRIHYLFIVPIPELLAYIRATPSIDGFIYVSASHNPIGHNGVKFGLREGVLGGENATDLIHQYQLLLQMDQEMENLFHLASTLNPNLLGDLCISIEGWKNAAEKAYKAFVYRMVTGTDDAHQQEWILKTLKRNIQREGCGIVIDYNGSARTLGIDREILTDLGVTLYERNETPRAFSHAILPEGDALELCREVLEGQKRLDNRFRFGYVPDCDGDRGNLVYYEEKPVPGEAGGAKILEAQQVFALACVSELSYQHWLDEWRTADQSGNPSEARVSRLAVVVNDPTSLRIDRIASRLSARVFRAEVGEANVVGLAKKLIQEGWRVPVYGEGSNGGNITYPSEVRDPLATVFSILKLLYLSSQDHPASSPFKIWCDASGFGERYTPHPDFSTVLDTLPVFTTLPVSAKEAVFPIQCTDQPSLKAAYEQIYWKEWQTRKESLREQMGIEGWKELNYEGLEERIGAGPASRRGTEKGGFKILFENSQGQGIAFLWMRKSGTEPVFRILVDLEGADKDHFHDLLSWHRSMIQKADERCRIKPKPDAMDIVYSISALMGMQIEDQRIPQYFPILSLKEESYHFLLSTYRDKKQRRGEAGSTYLSIPSQGLQFLVDPFGFIQTIFLYLITREGFHPFSQSLSLPFPSTRAELKTLLGEPLESGKTQDGFLSENEELWDVFRYLDVKIYAGYHPTDGQITRLTFSRFSPGGLSTLS
ncbi:MAG: phosphatidylglycerol lysyltransferase [Spirochaetes bacterium]|nr:phosphatidylglycerol lysyltransferase [Spirochaetota bacterium]